MDQKTAERFWRKVVRGGPEECWIWTGAKSDGYGSFHLDGDMVGAHRLSYQAIVGQVPLGTELDHLCRTRCCVNPGHLEPVSHAENVRRGAWTLDAAREAAAANRRARTHCKNGHAFDAVRTDGMGRICRECNRITMRAYRARKREAA